MNSKEAPSWLTPELRVRWEAYEAAARDRALRARLADLRERVSWAACATVVAIPVVGLAALAVGMDDTWATAGFVLAVAFGCSLSVLLLDIGPGREAAGQGAEETGEPPRTVPLVPPNQGSARMRPDDGGWR